MEPFELIGVFLLLYCTWTLLLHVFVVVAVFLVRKNAAVNAFYTIYMAGCVADTLSLINGGFTYCFLTGFLQADWFNGPITVALSQTIVWGARFSQMLTVLIIALNRLTAIRFPLKHSFIWNKTAERICAFIQVFSILAFGGTVVFLLRPKRIPSAFGGVITSYDIEMEQMKSVYVGSSILQTTNGLLVVCCYIVILHDIRAALKEMPTLSHRRDSLSGTHQQEQSLHKTAFVVCVVEILSVVQQLVGTQIIVARESTTELYIVRTAIYTSIPPYLLIFFSRSIRQRLFSMFAFRCGC